MIEALTIRDLLQHLESEGPRWLIAEWRTIPGFEGRYDVSRDGFIRSKDWSIRCLGRGGRIYERLHRGKRLKPGLHEGYPYVVLRKKDGASFGVHVHVIVCSVFHGPKPRGKEVNHKDHCRKNHRANNLEWVTRRQNIRHRDGDPNYLRSA